MIRGMPVYITEQDIIDKILCHALEPKEVRLIRRKETGESRGFAFVEFDGVDDAQEWIEAEQGMLQFHTWQVTMQYSHEREVKAAVRGVEPSKMLVDWKCVQCDVQNFKRREECFKCGRARPELDVSNTIHEEEEDETSPHPTSVVLLSNLDALTVDDSIRDALNYNKVNPNTIKNINIGREKSTGMSRGVCYIEMNSIVDSMMAYRQLYKNPPMIDGRILQVAYKRTDLGASKSKNKKDQKTEEEEQDSYVNKTNFTEEQLHKMADYSAGLYAQQPSEKDQFIKYYKKYYAEGGDPAPALNAIYNEPKEPPPVELGTVTVNGIEYKKYSTPDTSTYQFDESSGYYYDPLSTLYYDANSSYYYNSKTSSFCYWDATHETFLPAPDAAANAKATTEEGGEKGKEKGPGKEKVKSAKKIQKDMEKWAKLLNQKSKMPINQIKAAAPPSEPETASLQKGVADVAFSILQAKKEDSPNLAGMASFEGDDEEEELKLADWNSFACLLCKRQFQTKEKLMKHNTKSDLHMNNLAEWKQSRMDRRMAGMAGAGSSLDMALQYRDRAKERRHKFGDDDQPPPNRFKEKYNKAIANISASAKPDTAEQKINDSNVGNKMLQKMGWKEGSGLGKSNQGRTDIIRTDDGRTNTAGLGNKTIRRTNDDYRTAAKQTLFSRFNESRS